MTLDASGNLGLGATSISTVGSYRVAEINGTGGGYLRFSTAGSASGAVGAAGGGAFLESFGANPTIFYTNNAERARIDSSGSFILGTTAEPTGSTGGSGFMDASVGRKVLVMACTITSNANLAEFKNPNGGVGSISTNGSATAFNTSSDYRLKHDIQPMTGALAKVAQLKPVTYKWNADNSESQGFIAHELAEVAPYAVSGEKDGEQMQGVDYGKITPLLTAALQEAIAEIQSLKARVAELEAK
jgi:hypothetical protein